MRQDGDGDLLALLEKVQGREKGMHRYASEGSGAEVPHANKRWQLGNAPGSIVCVFDDKAAGACAKCTYMWCQKNSGLRAIHKE